jgi:erythromycin esterase
MKRWIRWLSVTLMFSVLWGMGPGIARDAYASLSAEDPKWTDWLNRHAHPVLKLEMEPGDSCRDLRFSKSVLKGKRIVMLGESSHGAAEFDSVKARWIRCLHEELGFDVIAFETGLGDAIMANYHASRVTPEETMRRSVYQIWQTRQTLPLFQYLKESKKGDPLILAGIDPQPTGSYKEYLREWLGSADPKQGEKAYGLEAYYEQVLYVEKDPDRFRAERNGRIEEYRALLNWMDRHESRLVRHPDDRKLFKMVRYVMQNRINELQTWVESAVLFRKYMEEGDLEQAYRYFEESDLIRDRLMARHLTWLAEELYPGKKIVVWAHNIHIRKANTKADNPRRPAIPRMGQLLPERLKKESYVVGLYMNRGESAGNDGTPIPVTFPHPEGSLESILDKACHANGFVDMARQRNRRATSWMFTERQALDWGWWHEKLVPAEQYDGILWIDEVHVPDYLFRDSEFQAKTRTWIPDSPDWPNSDSLFK